MGNGCMNIRPNEAYKKYFSTINISQLKQQWSAVQLYKIKSVFESFAVKSEDRNKSIILFQSLKQICSEFYRYDDQQIKRIYEIFDFEDKGCIDWNNFYTFMTICNQAPAHILSLLMFMIFDQSLAKRLNRDQINLLVDFNAHYIRQSSVDHQTFLYDPCEVGQILTPNDEFITIDKWLCESHKIFDFEKYRKFFNIFIEVKMEKQLIQNFQSWNEIFDENQNKYTSYIVDFKWFELWKAYALSEYGVRINSGLKNPNNTLKTLKSFKTKKTLKTLHSIKTQKKIINKAFVNNLCDDQLIKGSDKKSKVKNYNLVHGHIGSKPLRMFNQELEGQFLEVLAPQLVQNMDYVLVSQQVWKKLKFIYRGYPDFRRTGANNIELYPKRIKVFSALFRERLDYSSQVIRELAGYTTVQNLFKESLKITNLSQKQVFFKTIGMNKWQELTELSYMFNELTSQILIFLAYFQGNDSIMFKKNHCKAAQSISQVNLGDEIRYQHPQKSQLKKAIYMGQTQNGIHIIHFKGSSQRYDEYVEGKTFIQKATLVHRNSATVQQIRISPLDIPIIPIIKSFGFINSLILILISNSEIKSILAQFSQPSENHEILDLLANIYRQSKKKSRIDGSLIVELVEKCLSQFVNFQFGMIDDCYRSMMEILDKAMRRIQSRNIIREDYYFTMSKKIKCLHCSDLKTYNQKCYSLNIQLPQNTQKYFEFTFVPFSSSLKSLDIKKYGLKMKYNATYKQYRTQIGKLIECQNIPFVICEVYSNDIIKNFYFVKDQTTLEELNLRETDHIAVYQLCTSFERFIIDHYTQVRDITHKKFKKEDFIDCKVDEDLWIAGKIMEIEFMPYTQKTIIKVSHKESIFSTHKKEYELKNQAIAVFPTKSYLYSQQYHIKVLQRCYNEALKEMLPSNMPLVIVLTNWMRCKEFQFMVYQQLKCFIAQNFRFKDVHEFDQDDSFVGTNPKFLSYKYTKQEKVRRFKEYLMSDYFPYSISLLDLDGRCLICHKIHKSKIEKGQSDYYCSGCKLNHQNPILWQIKVHNCMVCIDWYGLDRFKKNIIKDHKSFTDMIMNKKNDIERLEKLIEQKLTKRVMILEQQCCNFPYKTTFSQEFKNYPQQLVIQIERMIDTGTTKSINWKHINFPIDDLRVKSKMYLLTGVISIEGTNTISYKNYISNQSQEWFEAFGQTIKKVKKNLVQKCCALFLIYKMKPVQQNEGKLSDCRQSEEFLASEQGNSSNFEPSEGSIRKNNKQLTINQRLERMDNDEDDFSYLNTENEDQIELEEGQDADIDSEVPPQRTNSKRSVHYVKDSKELIKSVSECGKSLQDERQNLVIIRLEKSHEKIGKAMKKSSSASQFDGEERRRQKITFELNKQESQNFYEDSQCLQNINRNKSLPQEGVFKTTISGKLPNTQKNLHEFKSLQKKSVIQIHLNQGENLSNASELHEQSSIKSVHLQQMFEVTDMMKLEGSKNKLNQIEFKKFTQSQ